MPASWSARRRRPSVCANPPTDALGSTQAGGELCERVVDGEKTGSGHVFDRDPLRERNLGRSMGARRGVLFIDGGQAVAGKANSATRTRAGHSRRWMRGGSRCRSGWSTTRWARSGLAADEQIRGAIAGSYALWDRCGSARQVVAELAREGQRLPRRAINERRVRWVAPDYGPPRVSPTRLRRRVRLWTQPTDQDVGRTGP